MKLQFAKFNTDTCENSGYCINLISKNLVVRQKTTFTATKIRLYAFPKLSTKVLTGKTNYHIDDAYTSDLESLLCLSKHGVLFHWDLSFLLNSFKKNAGINSIDSDKHQLKVTVNANDKIFDNLEYMVLKPKDKQSRIILPKFSEFPYWAHMKYELMFRLKKYPDIKDKP